MVSSAAFWAIMVNHFAADWASQTTGSWIPTWLSKVGRPHPLPARKLRPTAYCTCTACYCQSPHNPCPSPTALPEPSLLPHTASPPHRSLVWPLKIFGFELKKAGLVSALPAFASFLVVVGSGPLSRNDGGTVMLRNNHSPVLWNADRGERREERREERRLCSRLTVATTGPLALQALDKKWLGVTALRKLAQAVGLLLPAGLLAALCALHWTGA